MSDTSKTVKSDTTKTEKAEGVVEEQNTVAPADDPTAAPVTVVDPRLLVREEGFKGYITEFKRKVKGGELGSLPVVIGLIVIWTIFQFKNDRFLSAENLSNISFFLSATGMLAIGLVFVLLLGEIDLSVGSVSGLASTLFAVFVVDHTMNPWLSLLLTIITGIAIGALHGWFFAKLGVPAFVVTLAGFLGWNGLMLWLLGSSGTINIPSDSGPVHLLGQNSFFMDQASSAPTSWPVSVSRPCSSAPSVSSAAAVSRACRTGPPARSCCASAPSPSRPSRPRPC